jgi:glycosyltransferase involved in cell wall biosynthesis
MRVAFVYATPRADLREAIRRGEAPDTGLLGQNHLGEVGIDAEICESALRRKHRRGGIAHRLTWSARELSLPLELRAYDALVTTIGPSVALSSRAVRGPYVVLLNISLCQTLRRASAARRRTLAAGVRAAGAVLCFADAQRDSLLDLTGASEDRVASIPLGVDERFLTSHMPPPPDGTVLAVGRDLGRDYRTFAAAVSGLDAKVVLVASKRNLSGIELSPKVDVRVDVSAEELRGLYEKASCVVVPTRREGYAFGADCGGQTVVLDAFAMGRPVVASERSTLRGYLDDGRNGLVVPAEDPPELRAAIMRLLGDSDLASRLGAAGRSDVEARFTTTHLARSVADVLLGAPPLTAESADVGRR